MEDYTYMGLEFLSKAIQVTKKHQNKKKYHTEGGGRDRWGTLVKRRGGNTTWRIV